MLDREIHARSIIAFLVTILIMGAILRFVLPVRDALIATALPPYVSVLRIWESGQTMLERAFGVGDDEDVLATLEAKNLELETLLHEQERLFRQYYRLPNAQRAVPGTIIDPYADAIGSAATLRFAENGDVQKGDLVVSNGVLVGVIDRVADGIATLHYSAAPLHEQSAILQNGDVQIAVVGKGGGFYIAEILQDTPVSDGDIIMDARRRDVVLGEVVYVHRNPARPFVEALIRAPISASQLSDLLIVPHDR